jgi:hypothetical protein
VAAPPQTLEALVRDELRGPVRDLVRRLVPELVAEALNGTAESDADARPRLRRSAQEAPNANGQGSVAPRERTLRHPWITFTFTGSGQFGTIERSVGVL